MILLTSPLQSVYIQDSDGRGPQLLLIQCQFSLGCCLSCILFFLHQGAPHSSLSLLLAAVISWALANCCHSLWNHVARLYPLHSTERYCGKCITLLTSSRNILVSLQKAVVLVLALGTVAATATVYDHFLSQKDALKFWIPLTLCYTMLVVYNQEEQHRQSAAEVLLHSVVLRLGALLVLMLTVGDWSDVLQVLIAFLGEAVCLLPSGDLLKAALKEEEDDEDQDEGVKTEKQTRSVEIQSREGERRNCKPHFSPVCIWIDTDMASAAPPKRMVSSVFITLASPCRATVTQQQHTLQTHSAPTRDKQHTAVPSLRCQKEGQSPSESYNSADSTGRNHAGALIQTSESQSPKTAQPGVSHIDRHEDKENKGTEEVFPPTPPPPPSLPSPLGTDSASPNPPPAQDLLSPPLPTGQQPVYNRKLEKNTPSTELNRDEQSHGIHNNGQDKNQENKDVCGFCRKTVALTEPAIEALNRTYHDSCFQCRSCHVPLAGKQYYNKSGIPLCEDCYQASLELCWACGEVIKHHVIRALERAYHPSCFTCATCNQQIGEQRFAQGEVGEVYCLQDYYRKYAPQCSACKKLIIPKEDGTDSYTVECMGCTYHEDCYRCEMCVIQLSPEPNERGCYPLDGKRLCKSCHLTLVSGQH
ncbi:hypothetical protein LDENG_00129380 [Lucifuga dentata]|nr:hypothetical protein LDENG_00129380 [Lucifuga dentata]